MRNKQQAVRIVLSISDERTVSFRWGKPGENEENWSDASVGEALVHEHPGFYQNISS